MKKCSTSLIIREVEIKTTSYHLTSARMTIINKQEIKIWRKGNTCALFEGVESGAATMENSVEFPQKIKNRAVI